MGWSLRMISARRGVLAVCLLLSSMGCAALPDVSPFAAATAHLSESVRTTGRTVAQDIATLNDGDAKAREFNKAWEARVAVMNSMCIYADSLVGIVDAAHDAGASAESIANKVGDLATAAGIINPAAGPSVKVAADVAKLVWANIALAKGASDLQKALDAAQPAIVIITDTIAKDTDDIRKIVRAALSKQEAALLEDASINSIVGFHETLAPKAKARIIDATPSEPPTSAELTQLDDLRRALTATQAEYDQYRDNLRKLRERRAAMLALLAGTDDAISQWSIAHRNLVEALRQRKPVSVESLTTMIVELRSLVRKVREL